jgi:hypothetical protein
MFKVKTELKHLLILTFFPDTRPALSGSLTKSDLLAFPSSITWVRYEVLWSSESFENPENGFPDICLPNSYEKSVLLLAGWLAACLYRVVEVEGGLLICL